MNLECETTPLHGQQQVLTKMSQDFALLWKQYIVQITLSHTTNQRGYIPTSLNIIGLTSHF